MTNIQQIIKDSKFIPEMKKILFEDCFAQLEGTFGISKFGNFESLNNLPNIKEGTESFEIRKKLEKYVMHKKESGVSPKEAVVDFVKEYAFTYLNRFVAFKMMEGRKILRQTVSREFNSNSFKFYLADHAEDEKRWKQGNVYEAYKNFIHWQCRELCKDNEIKVLFDPDNIVSQIFPQERTLKHIFKMINQGKLALIWKEDEVIGWVYQYFIEDDKDRVFDKIYRQKQKMELRDIAPATQIFTPRWIVQYIVENTLGRLWIRMHPDTLLKEKMKYYVPNENDKELIPLRAAKEITLLDPACGTMHFGMVAFDLFYEMYLEEIENAGKDTWPESPSCEKEALIPASIIENNLYGIDIDLRPIQLSALSLYLKAKSKYREILIEKYNLIHTDIPAFSDESINEFIDLLSPKYELTKKLFKIVMPELAKAYYLGSLLKLEDIINSFLEKQYTILSKKFGNQMHFAFAIKKEQKEILFKKELVWSEVKEELRHALNEFIEQTNGDRDPFVAQESKKGVYLIDTLMKKYDVVVTNPPFSGKRNWDNKLTNELKKFYPKSFYDLYSCFIERCIDLIKKDGFAGLVSMQSFMFVISFKELREYFLSKIKILTLLHFGPHAFTGLSGVKASTCAFCVELSSNRKSSSKSIFFKLTNSIHNGKKIIFEEEIEKIRHNQQTKKIFVIEQEKFNLIPASPMIYWVNKKILDLFQLLKSSLREIIEIPNRTKTGFDEKFIRYEWEVGYENIGKNKKWVKYTKGEGSESWLGRINRVIDWSQKTRNYFRNSESCRITDKKYWFAEGITYSGISIDTYSFRYLPPECVYDVGGPALIPKKYSIFMLLGFLNSEYTKYILSLINPTVNLQTGDLNRIPFQKEIPSEYIKLLEKKSYKCYILKHSILVTDEIFYKFNRPVNWETGIRDKLKLEKDIFILETEISDIVYKMLGIEEHDIKQIQNEIGQLPRDLLKIDNLTSAKLKVLSLLYLNKHAFADIIDWIKKNCSGENNEDKFQRILRLNEKSSGKKFLTLEEICLASGFHPETVYEYIKLNNLERKEERFALAVQYISYALGVVMGRFGVNGIKPDDDGITVMDEGHSDDVTARIQDVLDKILNEKEAKEVINIIGGDLRKFLMNDFFVKYHIPMYKKRPMYWLLQTAKKNYGFYIYNLKFTQDTLYSLIQKYIDPRINLEKLRLKGIYNKKDAVNTPKEKREIDNLIAKSEDFLEELRAFKRDIQEVIDTGFKPDIDDGVILNMAPLYKLIPWKEPEKYYKNLQMDQYKWAHVSRYFKK